MTNSIEAPVEREAVVQGKINVGTYSDGSGPVATVSWDTDSEYTPKSVWVSMYSDQWIAIDAEHIEALCRAMKHAASAIERSDHIGEQHD